MMRKEKKKKKKKKRKKRRIKRAPNRHRSSAPIRTRALLQPSRKPISFTAFDGEKRVPWLFFGDSRKQLAPAFIFSSLTPPRRSQLDRDAFSNRTIPPEAPHVSASLKKQNKKKKKRKKKRKNAHASLCRC
jgi:hypothetical protein